MTHSYLLHALNLRYEKANLPIITLLLFLYPLPLRFPERFLEQGFYRL